MAACRLEHFARTRGSPDIRTAAGLRAHGFARLTAIRATVRFVLKTFGGVELLLAAGERELAPAVNTVQHFIDVH
ncbi:MAG TPA: hypothetical protein VIG51_13595 [Candidatus Baltobacteraceae bacterium]